MLFRSTYCCFGMCLCVTFCMIWYIRTIYSYTYVKVFLSKGMRIRNEMHTCLAANHNTKTDVLANYCAKTQNMTKSLAIPPYYPRNGTGALVTTQLPAEYSKVNELCHVSPSLEAIVPVYSAYGNYERRMAIRNTTGQMCDQYKCKLVFIVGFPKDGKITPEMKEEYDTYVDIIIINRVDTYRDLNDKAVAMLDWIIEFCSTAKYVIHFVDDTFVNIRLFLEDLHYTGNAVYGVVLRAGPMRAKTSKYHVHRDEYPYPSYPDFVVGVAYAFSNSITKSLRCAVHDAIYVWLEDVWLMGYVRMQAGIAANQTNRETQGSGHIVIHDIDRFLFKHSVNVDEFYKLHQALKASIKV